jgi:O-acetyl-ADP-ribose deacetylase (regulator of RNase III)
MRIKLNEVTLQCLIGNIAQQADITAVVNAANAQLLPGGGVAKALHAAAGPELAEAFAAYAPIAPGEAVVTGAFGLPNDFVIHCLGPVFGRDEPFSTILARCYSQALKVAESTAIESIAFPAISMGAFGFPVDEGAEIACNAVADEATRLERLRLVRFVLHDQLTYEAFSVWLIRAVGAIVDASSEPVSQRPYNCGVNSGEH